MDRAEMIIKAEGSRNDPQQRPASGRQAKRPSAKTRIGKAEFKDVKIDNSQKGLTLIEVLVALTILAIGLLGVALMQVISITGNTFSKEMAVATELGQDMLEKLRTFEYTETVEDPTLTEAGSPHDNSELSNATGFAQPNPLDARGMRTDAAGVDLPLRLYTRTWTVVDDDPVIDMKTIAVTVSWQEKGTTDRSVTISAVKVQE